MIRVFILFFILAYNYSYAQQREFKGFLIDYSYQFPIAKLSEKFGNNSSIGINLINKTKTKIFYGIKGHYFFGGKIKDSTIFDNISTDNGFVIDGNGTFANILLLQEGLNVTTYAGYAIHLNEKNPTGVYISVGLGLLQHRIRIDTKNQYIPQLSNDYKQGYDQLTNGISTNFVIDYVYFEKNNRLKVFAGIDYTYALTKERRSYYFPDLSPPNNEFRNDQLFGIHIGIIVPVNRKNEEEFHYF